MALAENPDPALRSDTAGVVRIGGTRVSLRSIVVAFERGATAEEIAIQYPALDLADVYAAITFHLRHRDQVLEKLAQEDGESEVLFRAIEAQSSTARLRERLRARRMSEPTV
jgi:uncharacterized protein (DUF433 family)